ncbi:MAG: methyltransferase domain-containing protein [Acidiferrobacterales bacterium]|nr:methyltransferase domain-containing protein [Acidiferrobacterales bacterium]
MASTTVDNHSQWHGSALGQQLVRSGADSIQRLLPSQYYRVALQVAGPPDAGYLDNVESDVHFRIDDASQPIGNGVDVVAEAQWLPFGSNSIDLLLLPHVLEFARDPHNVLREISQCVAPEGIVVIAGFNPHSMLGVSKNLLGLRNSILRDTRLYSVLRVRDWMSLLGFDSVAGEFVFFRPPVEQESRLDRLKRFETVGSRWWPGLGSVYVLVFRKKELGIRMNGNLFSRALRKKRRILSPVAERCRPSD